MADRPTADKITSKFLAEINACELACRIFEAMGGIPIGMRPYPNSPEKSMAFLKSYDPEMHDRAMNAAQEAMKYLVECINSGGTAS